MGSPERGPADERHRGYVQALSELSLPRDPALEIFGDFPVNGGYAAMEKLCREKEGGMEFDALFIANYFMHIGATNFLNTQEFKLKPPAIASFDDMDLSPLLSFAHYTVSQPMIEMGSEAARLLIERMGGDDAPGKVIRLNTEIVAYQR